MAAGRKSNENPRTVTRVQPVRWMSRSRASRTNVEPLPSRVKSRNPLRWNTHVLTGRLDWVSATLLESQGDRRREFPCFRKCSLNRRTIVGNTVSPGTEIGNADLTPFGTDLHKECQRGRKWVSLIIGTKREESVYGVGTNTPSR